MDTLNNNIGEIPSEITPSVPIITDGKTRDWKGYIKTNLAGHADCQLVTACNAYYHLTGNKIDQNSYYYKRLLVAGICRHGSCINIKGALDMLGIEIDSEYHIWDLSYLLKENNFFGIKLWHKFFGYHSVSVVDYCEKTDAVRVTNLKHVTSLKGWIFVEDLKPHINSGSFSNKPSFTTYKLK